MPAEGGRAGLPVGAGRHRMGGEQQISVHARVGEAAPGLVDGTGEGGDETGVIVELSQPLQPRRDLSPVQNGATGPGDVLVVLAAPGVTAPGRGREDERIADPVVGHLLHGVFHHRMPVPVAEVDRQVTVSVGESGLDMGDDLAVEVVEGATSAEREVVLTDHLQPGAGYTPAAGDVLQKRDDVLGPLRTTEGKEQQGIDGVRVDEGIHRSS